MSETHRNRMRRPACPGGDPRRRTPKTGGEQGRARVGGQRTLLARNCDKRHSPCMEDPARWLSLADAIDCDRARELGRELGAAPERAALVLLGTAFPPLCTLTGPRVDAFARLVSEGLQSERRGRSEERRVGKECRSRRWAGRDE